MQNFEDYLCERNDTIDNAAYQLIGVLTAEDPGASLEDDPATPNWDMAIIGEVVDAVKEIIIDLKDLSHHHPNAETEFASFTPATEVDHEE